MQPMTPEQIIARMREEGRKIQRPEMSKEDKAHRLRVRRRIENLQAHKKMGLLFPELP